MIADDDGQLVESNGELLKKKPARQDALYVTTHRAFPPIGSHPHICHEDTTRYDIKG